MPTLSLAMIVKNEAANLGRCLESVRGLVDEMVVVDTGSEDGTPALAQAHGARLGHFPWRDDFAAARNASLELCRGDWILLLDADEAVGAADHAAIRQALERPEAAFTLVGRNYTRDARCPPVRPGGAAEPGPRRAGRGLPLLRGPAAAAPGAAPPGPALRGPGCTNCSIPA